MDLRHLRSFIVAAEEENLHKAAARLHITQSALSVQIRDLEQELGTALFERRARRLHLSEVGRIYLGDARKILAEMQRANERVKQAAQGQVGTLRLSLNKFPVNRSQVFRSINAFRTVHPEIALSLSQMNSVKLIEALRERKIDAGYVYGLSAQHTEFERCEIGKIEWVVAMPKDHRLANHARLMLSDLGGESFVWLKRGNNLRLYDFLLGECVSHGLSPRIGQLVMSWEMSLDIVAAGMGIAFVLESAARGYEADLVFKKPEDLSVSIAFDLAWRRDNQSPTLERFIDAVRPFYAPDNSVNSLRKMKSANKETLTNRRRTAGRG